MGYPYQYIRTPDRRLEDAGSGWIDRGHLVDHSKESPRVTAFEPPDFGAAGRRAGRAGTALVALRLRFRQGLDVLPRRPTPGGADQPLLNSACRGFDLCLAGPPVGRATLSTLAVTLTKYGEGWSLLQRDLIFFIDAVGLPTA